ncbi:hypothetical protein AB656_04480 [Bifidobacterium actinocoloniiforme DSM 22766]|nr:hypothetical protein AB656_04480 [Bifidobacterium actinocoloniiforme DSM 22766]
MRSKRPNSIQSPALRNCRPQALHPLLSVSLLLSVSADTPVGGRFDALLTNWHPNDDIGLIKWPFGWNLNQGFCLIN